MVSCSTFSFADGLFWSRPAPRCEDWGKLSYSVVQRIMQRNEKGGNVKRWWQKGFLLVAPKWMKYWSKKWNLLFMLWEQYHDQGLSSPTWTLSLLVLSLLSFSVTTRQRVTFSCLSLKEPQRQVNPPACITSTSPFFPLKHKERIHISLPFLSSTKAQGRN